jgi:hypothetical protein
MGEPTSYICFFSQSFLTSSSWSSFGTVYDCGSSVSPGALLLSAPTLQVGFGFAESGGGSMAGADIALISKSGDTWSVQDCYAVEKSLPQPVPAIGRTPQCPVTTRAQHSPPLLGGIALLFWDS